MTNSRRVAALVALITLLLAGCVNVTGDLHVASDNQITGTLDIAVSKELAQVAGITSADQLREQLISEGNIPEGMSVTTSSNDDALVLTLSGNLSDTSGLFTATTEGDVQTFKVTSSQGTGETSSASPADGSEADKYRMLITAHFAGTVTAVDPQGSAATAKIVNANTVEFSGPALSKWAATATVDLSKPVTDDTAAPAGGSAGQANSSSGSASGSAPGPALGIVAGLAVLVVLGGTAAVVLVSRRPKPAPATDDPPADPDLPPAA